MITAVSGQSFTGILSATIRIINKASFDTNKLGTLYSGIGCFAIAAVIQFAAAIAFRCAAHSQFVQRYMLKYWALRHCKYLFESKDFETKTNSNITMTMTGNGEERWSDGKTSNHSKSDTQSVVEMDDAFHYHYDYSHLHSDFVDPTSMSTHRRTTTFSHTKGPEMNTHSLRSALSIKTGPSSTPKPPRDIASNLNKMLKSNLLSDMSSGQTQGINANAEEISYCSVIRKIYKCLLSIFIGYFGTFLVFPATALRLPLYFGRGEHLIDTGWNGVILYGVWSVFNWIGIYLATKRKMGSNYDNLWLCQLLWLLIMYGGFSVVTNRSLARDFLVIALDSMTPMIFGFLSARTYAELPCRVGLFEQEIAQAITQLTQLSGIVVGSWMAFTFFEMGIRCGEYSCE